jgi:flagellar hook assembly protein FlgD
MRIEVSAAGRYRIEIYDIQGKLLNTVADQDIEQGEYYLDWYGKAYNNAPLPGGVYIIKLSGENQNYSTRVIILK